MFSHIRVLRDRKAANSRPERKILRRVSFAPVLFAFLSLAIATTSTAATEEIHSTQSIIRAGHEIAVESCTGCHVVSTHQELRPVAGGAAPSFEEIANRASTTASSLRDGFTRTHLGKHAPLTSSISSTTYISDKEASNVIAYILSERHAH